MILRVYKNLRRGDWSLLDPRTNHVIPKRLLREAAQARADLTSAYRALDRRVPAEGVDLGAGARIVRT